MLTPRKDVPTPRLAKKSNNTSEGPTDITHRLLRQKPDDNKTTAGLVIYIFFTLIYAAGLYEQINVLLDSNSKIPNVIPKDFGFVLEIPGVLKYKFLLGLGE